MYPRRFNIVAAVDVAAALSHRTLEGNIVMMDDSWGSLHRGSSRLSTECWPGSEVIWTPRAIDVQTPLAIRSIEFLCYEPSRASFPGELQDAEGEEAEAAEGEEAAAEGEEVAAAAAATPGHPQDLSAKIWGGIVPWCAIPGWSYRYRLVLQMAKGENSIMSIDTLSLRIIHPPF